MTECVTNEPPLELLITAGEPAAEPRTQAAPQAPSGAVPALVRFEKWLKVLHIALIVALIVSVATVVKLLTSDGATAKSPQPAVEKTTELAHLPSPAPANAAAVPVDIETPASPEPKPSVEPAPSKVEALRAAEPAPAAPANGNGHHDAPKPDPGPSLEELQVTALLEEAAELERDKPAEALSRYAKVLEMRPDRTPLWRTVGDLHLACGDGDAAARAYRLFLQYHPKQADAFNNLGVIELRQGRAGEALACFQRAIEIAPSANVYHNLGNLHLRQGENERAAGAYLRAIEYDPKHEDARFNLAIALERQGRLAEASSTLAPLCGASDEAARERSRIEAMMGGAEARRALETARASRDAPTVMAVAAGFRRVGELEMALALLDRAVELAPQDATALCNRGAVRQQMGRAQEAAADYEAALRLDAACADAHFNLGVLREERGQLVKALEHYAAAVKARPSMAPAHNNVGVLYLKVNQAAKAVECFRRAAELDRSFAPARLNLGWAYLALVQKDRALEELRAYAALVPKDQRDPAAVRTIEQLERK